MDEAEYPRMAAAEEKHWWYSGMNALSASLLGQFLPPATSRRILDAGCGTGGAMAFLLPRFGQPLGVDFSPVALRLAQKRRLPGLAQASVTALPFAPRSFDLLVSFDVLYERGVADDRLALREFERVLRPGGWLLLRLPAFDFLRGRHDETVHTARRYRAPQVKGLLEQAGFVVRRCAYANFWLFPFLAVKRSSERLFASISGQSDLVWQAGPLNGLLRALLASESLFSPPFGSSVVALAQKNTP